MHKIRVTYIVFDKAHVKEYESPGPPYVYWLKRTVQRIAHKKWHTGYVKEIEIERPNGVMEIHKYKVQTDKYGTANSIRHTTNRI